MPRVFYVVRCDFPRPDLLEEWDPWYVGHIDLLLGAQRFRAPEAPDGRPHLALYELNSAEVMRSDEYERARGFGGWEVHVTRWTRDLVEAPDGADSDFATPAGERLWAAFFAGAAPPDAARNIGLDQSFAAALWRRREFTGAAMFTPRTQFAKPRAA